MGGLGVGIILCHPEAAVPELEQTCGGVYVDKTAHDFSPPPRRELITATNVWDRTLPSFRVGTKRIHSRLGRSGTLPVRTVVPVPLAWAYGGTRDGR